MDAIMLDDVVFDFLNWKMGTSKLQQLLHTMFETHDMEWEKIKTTSSNLNPLSLREALCGPFFPCT